MTCVSKENITINRTTLTTSAIATAQWKNNPKGASTPTAWGGGFGSDPVLVGPPPPETVLGFGDVFG